MRMKKCYEMPLIERNYVELEDGVCTPSSVFDSQSNKVEATTHTHGYEGTGIGGSDENSDGFTDIMWD